ncbi:MAG: hypothetical protein JXR25_12195 [Pontiellaceae bacterium]|nr:hypothetical protein [Pontiellaceae bacterium]
MPAEIEKEELLKAIRKDGPHKVVQQYRHNLLPSRLLIDLYGENPERDVLLFLALYPTVPSQVLEDLTEAYPDPDILAAAAVNPRCTHLLLVRMARDGGTPVRAALAANKQQNNKITARLITDDSLLVRAALAGNGAIANNFRATLAQDPEPGVRSALAGSSKLPTELVHALSSDESAVVRTEIYGLANVDSEFLLGWANSDNPEAQRLLLTRSKLDPEVIEALALSPDPEVQQAIRPLRTPTPAEWLAKAESEEEAFRIEAAVADDLPPEIQHQLAGDPSSEVRTALAGNPAIDEEVALWIAASNDTQSCEALAANPGLTDPVKIELCHHEHEVVRLRMAYRDDLTNELLDILVNQHGDLKLIGHLALRNISYPGIKPELIEQLLAHRRPSLQAFAAQAGALSDAQVRKLIRNDFASVRLALCGNPILTAAALEELSRDWNPSVADGARERLENLPPPDPEQEEEIEENGSQSLVSRIVDLFK